jgi:hypothetical protein
LGSRYLSQWIKQLELKADHFHIVLRLRIRGNFPSLPLYSFVALCFGTDAITFFHHHQQSSLWSGSSVLTESRLWREDDQIDIFVDYCVLDVMLCGWEERMFWRNLSTKLHGNHMSLDSIAVFIVTVWEPKWFRNHCHSIDILSVTSVCNGIAVGFQWGNGAATPGGRAQGVEKWIFWMNNWFSALNKLRIVELHKLQ